MDQDKAWNNFVNSGSVKDYIIYSQMKNDEDMSQGVTSYANQHGWSGNNGEEHRGD